MTNEIADSTTPNSQSTAVKPSRRQFLRTAAIGGVLGLTGCLSAGSETGEATPTAERQAIEDISFEGEHLVLTATEEFRGTELHVVDPTETVWAKTETEPTTGKARIRLLDVGSTADDRHYPPGAFRFVFNPRKEEPHTEILKLVPNLSIVDIAQSRGDQAIEYGRMEIQIRNNGTGPTWVNDIAYENSPNYAANDDLSDSSYPSLHGVKEVTEAIVLPEQSVTFQSRSLPLRFVTEREFDCSTEQFTLMVKVGSPGTKPVRQNVVVTTNGESTSVSQVGAYVCSDVQVSIAENSSE